MLSRLPQDIGDCAGDALLECAVLGAQLEEMEGLATALRARVTELEEEAVELREGKVEADERAQEVASMLHEEREQHGEER